MNELKHYGVLGMKWGVRKERARAMTKKTAAVIERYDRPTAKLLRRSDVKRAKYLNEPLIKRVVKPAAKIIGMKLMSDVIRGEFGNYSKMSKSQITKKIIDASKDIAITTAVNEALARSALSKYNESGKIIPGMEGKGLLTKEDIIQASINSAILSAPVFKEALSMTAQAAAATRAKNEARVKQWGGNILSNKVADVVWQSDDLSTAILNKLDTSELTKKVRVKVH